MGPVCTTESVELKKDFWKREQVCPVIMLQRTDYVLICSSVEDRTHLNNQIESVSIRLKRPESFPWRIHVKGRACPLDQEQKLPIFLSRVELLSWQKTAEDRAHLLERRWILSHDLTNQRLAAVSFSEPRALFLLEEGKALLGTQSCDRWSLYNDTTCREQRPSNQLCPKPSDHFDETETIPWHKPAEDVAHLLVLCEAHCVVSGE